MIVLDSSVWLELLLDGANAPEYRHLLVDPDDLLLPYIVIFEVTRVLRRIAPDRVAEALFSLGKVETVSLDADLAEYASLAAYTHGLAMGDAIIYTTALVSEAELWTQDADLRNLPNVHYMEKRG